MGKSARWLKKLLGIKKSQKKEKNSAEAPVKKNDIIEHVSPKKSTYPQQQVVANVEEPVHKTTEWVPPQYEKPSPAVKKVQYKESPVKETEQAPTPTTAAATTTNTTEKHPVPGSYAELDQDDDIFKGVVSKEDLAAVKVQTAYRSYLARRALRASKGVIRLQALARGHAVRKQAAVALRCVQAIVRVQAIFRGRQVRMSEQGLAVQYVLRRYRQQADPWHFEDTSMYRHGGIRSRSETERPRVIAFNRQLQCYSPRGTPVFIDSAYESDSGWVWLERWTAARPWAVSNVVDAFETSDFSPRLSSDVRVDSPPSDVKGKGFHEDYYHDAHGAAPAAEIQEVHEFEEPEFSNAQQRQPVAADLQPPTKQAVNFNPREQVVEAEPKRYTAERNGYNERSESPDKYPVVEDSFQLSEPIVEPPADDQVDQVTANGHGLEHGEEHEEVENKMSAEDRYADHEEEDMEEDDDEEEELSTQQTAGTHPQQTAKLSPVEGTPQQKTRVPSYMAATQSAKAKVRSQSPKSSSPTVKRRFSTTGKVEPRRLSLPAGSSPAAVLEASPRRMSMSGTNGRVADPSRSPKFNQQRSTAGAAAAANGKGQAEGVRRSAEIRKSFKY